MTNIEFILRPSELCRIEHLGLSYLVDDYLKLVGSRDVNRFKWMIGLNEESQNYVVFHGTVSEKLPHIKIEGMRAFAEDEGWEPRIYVTPSPFVALLHAIENGPHDTSRLNGKIEEVYSQDEPVLLVIKIPKSYLENHPESSRKNTYPVPNASGENSAYTRLSYFEKELLYHAWLIRVQGYGTPHGIRFPIDTIPQEFIYVRTRSGDIPIKDVSDDFTYNPNERLEYTS